MRFRRKIVRYRHPIYGWGAWLNAEEAFHSLIEISEKEPEYSQGSLLSREAIESYAIQQRVNLFLISPYRGVKFVSDDEDGDMDQPMYEVIPGDFRSYLAPSEMPLSEVSRSNKLLLSEFVNLTEREFLNLSLFGGRLGKSSGFIENYSITHALLSDGYELRLLSSLRSNEWMPYEVIYLSPNGDYRLRNDEGFICEGTLVDIELKDLNRRLDDYHLKEQVLDALSEAGCIKRLNIPIKAMINLSLKQYHVFMSVFDLHFSVKRRLASYGTTDIDAHANNKITFDDFLCFSELQIRLLIPALKDSISINEIIEMGHNANNPEVLSREQKKYLKSGSVHFFLKNSCMSIEDVLTLNQEDHDLLDCLVWVYNHPRISSSEYEYYFKKRLMLDEWGKILPSESQFWKNKVAIFASRWLPSFSLEDGKYKLRKNEYIINGLIDKPIYDNYVRFMLKYLFSDRKTHIQLDKLDEKKLLSALHFYEDVGFVDRFDMEDGCFHHYCKELDRYGFWYLINSTHELREFIKERRAGINESREGPLSLEKIFKKLHKALIQYTVLNTLVETNRAPADVLRYILSFLHKDKILGLSRPYLKLIQDRYNAGQPRFFLNAPIERFELGPDNVDIPAPEAKNAI